MHPSGLQVVMGCRQGLKVMSRVYTVLADSLKLLYEVDSSPKALLMEVGKEFCTFHAAAPRRSKQCLTLRLLVCLVVGCLLYTSPSPRDRG